MVHKIRLKLLDDLIRLGGNRYHGEQEHDPLIHMIQLMQQVMLL